MRPVPDQRCLQHPTAAGTWPPPHQATAQPPVTSAELAPNDTPVQPSQTRSRLIAATAAHNHRPATSTAPHHPPPTITPHTCAQKECPSYSPSTEQSPPTPSSPPGCQHTPIRRRQRSCQRQPTRHRAGHQQLARRYIPTSIEKSADHQHTSDTHPLVDTSAPAAGNPLAGSPPAGNDPSVNATSPAAGRVSADTNAPADVIAPATGYWPANTSSLVRWLVATQANPFIDP